jgi:hypothetical protein
VSLTPQPPKLIAIDPDDHYADRVGHTRDGLQVFVTTPFIPSHGNEAGREFLAAFIFDGAGKLLEALIDDLGPRATVDSDDARRLLEKRMSELGHSTPGASR